MQDKEESTVEKENKENNVVLSATVIEMDKEKNIPISTKVLSAVVHGLAYCKWVECVAVDE